jgi:hypothetical protein
LRPEQSLSAPAMAGSRPAHLCRLLIPERLLVLHCGRINCVCLYNVQQSTCVHKRLHGDSAKRLPTAMGRSQSAVLLSCLGSGCYCCSTRQYHGAWLPSHLGQRLLVAVRLEDVLVLRLQGLPEAHHLCREGRTWPGRMGRHSGREASQLSCPS